SLHPISPLPLDADYCNPSSSLKSQQIKKSCFTCRSSEQERLLHHPNVVAFYGVVQDGPGGTLATCSFEGGIAGEPGSEAHGGYTFCGLATLILINEVHQFDLRSLLSVDFMEEPISWLMDAIRFGSINCPSKQRLDISLRANTVYALDSLRHGSVRDELKSTVNTGLRMLYAEINTRARPLTWVSVKCAQQPGNTECGYYVMKFMQDIVRQKSITITNVAFLMSAYMIGKDHQGRYFLTCFAHRRRPNM
uniref:Uncharacterized protein n=1 Tax=Cucumis melo TaxID=3656 RepID=A0A9I9EBF4_CUCME